MTGDPMPHAARTSLRFTRVEIESWRNFKQVDVALQERVFLVGPNASGKSNFLDVFRFLHDIVTVGGGFQAAVARRGGAASLCSLTADRSSEIALRVSIGYEDGPGIWQYEIRFRQEPQGPRIRRETVVHKNSEILNRPDADDRRDPQRLTQTYLEQVNANQSFREVADFFSSVRYVHLIPQLVREPERSLGRRNDPFGGDFLEQIAGTPPRAQKARLKKVVEALRLAVPQLLELELGRDPVRGTPHLRGRYEHWRPEGQWQTEEELSDGTLRLIGLLWASLEPSGPLLLEEPELSLHPEVVRFLPQLFARLQRRLGRQILLSTHSPDLLRDEGIGLDEVLLLEPGQEGTSIRTVGSLADIRTLLEGGLSLADVIGPRTRPARIEQLPQHFAD
jgi:AAA domain, putative AbiEii toxin, Type IV TA system